MIEAVKILLIEPSYIIKEGLRSALGRFGLSFRIDEVDEVKENLVLTLEKFTPRIVFANHRALETKWAGNRSAAVFDEVLLVGMYNEKVTLFEMARYDEVLCIEENKQQIISSLQNILKKAGLLSNESETENLSEREREVLRFVALGLTNNEIAERLFISTFTVMTHRKNITRKLGIKTVSGLTVYAILNKIIESGEVNVF